MNDQTELRNGGYTNVGPFERALSAAAGAKMVRAGLARANTATGKLIALTGAYLTYRGLSGHCSAYASLGATRPKRYRHFFPTEIRVRESIAIHRSTKDLYAFWRDLTNLPRVMCHVQEITIIDDRRSRWRVDGPAGGSIEWEALITRDEAERCIAWASIDGDYLQHHGAVGFEPLPGDRGTIVRVLLFYRPLGGAAGALLARAFRREPSQEIRDDLRRFKQLMETGEVASNAGPSARARYDWKNTEGVTNEFGRRREGSGAASSNSSRQDESGAASDDDARPRRSEEHSVAGAWSESAGEFASASEPPESSPDQSDEARH
jgi:uncharacterized membrane protein